jgi:hypothetical protein
MKWRHLSRFRLLKLALVLLTCVHLMFQLLQAYHHQPLHLTQLDATSTRAGLTSAFTLPTINNNHHVQGLPVPSSSTRLIDSYNPSFHPVLPSFASLSSSPNSKFPISVGLVTTHPLVGEAMHFLHDGIMGSEYLELVGIVSLFDAERNVSRTKSKMAGITHFFTNSTTESKIPLKPTHAQVWLVDGQHVAKLKRPFLDDLLRPPTTIDGTPPPSWKVLFVDFSDRFQFQFRHYNRLGIWENDDENQNKNMAHVRIAVRSIVQGRHFDTQTSSINPGTIAPNIATSGGPMLHCPYAVRSDIVDAVQQELSLNQPMRSGDDSSRRTQQGKSPPWDAADRPLDVLHMWNISSKEGMSQLRNVVSRAVREWNGTTIEVDYSMKRRQPPHSDDHAGSMKNTRTIRTSIAEHGRRRKLGRNSASQAYVKAMLQAKIVIVAQKDDWEDHYRLLEAMACGPLVMTDTMLSLPRGLNNGTHLIMYSNVQQLWSSVKYYLVHEEERQMIAQRGWQMAMQQHRSWHRMEELVFGNPRTTTTGPLLGSTRA